MSQPVVLSFFAAWCSGCRRLHPKLMQIASQNPSVTFIKVGWPAEHTERTVLDVLDRTDSWSELLPPSSPPSQLTASCDAQVNAGAERMRETCEAMGVTTLPYFILYSSGKVVHRFSLNLSRVATLRTAIESIAQPQDALHDSGNWGQALAAPQNC